MHRSITLKDRQGNEHELRFTARARYLFEETAGYSIANARILRAEVSDLEATQVLWAGLNGARLKRGLPKLSIDDVLELQDELEQRDVFKALGQAIQAAFPKPDPEESDGDSSEGKGD